MSLQLVKAYCEYVSKAASEAGWKLRMEAGSYIWMKDGEQFGSPYHVCDWRDALYQSCMDLDNQKLHLPPLEIK